MTDVMKRVIVALIIPLVISGVICGVMFKINSHDAVMEAISGPQTETYVEINAANWSEYFTIGQDIMLTRNEADEVVAVNYVTTISLKDEYKDRIIVEEENRVSFVGDYEIEEMAYEITDAKTGEWKIIGEAKTPYYHASENTRYSLDWTTTQNDLEDYTAVCELWSGATTKDPLAMEVPQGEWEIQSAFGHIYLEQE